jgi:succinyl-CoA synthetase beta subunit
LEINPLVVKDGAIYPLDLAAKVDQTADFECGAAWGKLDFPAPFGRGQTPEEKFIASLDAKTGASLKLTILNPDVQKKKSPFLLFHFFFFFSFILFFCFF